MKVKILEVSTDELINAFIRKGKAGELPSMQDNWRFNFGKQLQKLKHAAAFVLVTEETPTVIEGCMIFQMRDKTIPYMAFVEVAPHNQGDDKRFDHVAGCLIAYAFKQSLIKAKAEYKEMLMFDVLESNEEAALRLMALYCTKYRAKLVGGTRMIIEDEDGYALIAQYLSE